MPSQENGWIHRDVYICIYNGISPIYRLRIYQLGYRLLILLLEYCFIMVIKVLIVLYIYILHILHYIYMVIVLQLLKANIL